jgi:tetratricopeptide (TPR) repeat protein
MPKTASFVMCMIWMAAAATVAAQTPGPIQPAPAAQTTLGSAQPEPTEPAEPAPTAESVSEFTEWNPLKANKDMEVGTFYLKRGNYEAAIERFEEAAQLQPGLARPYLKLGETYEKKKEWPTAVASYRKYLELFRAAPDAKKVQKRIVELEKRIAREAAAEARQNP